MRLTSPLISIAVASVFLSAVTAEAVFYEGPRSGLNVRYQSAVEEDEDTLARIEWFEFQRLYPSGSIPHDARIKAREAVQSQIKPGGKPLWRSIGPTPLISRKAKSPGRVSASGRINAIAVSPVNKNLIIIGSAAGGIWRSVDAGITFRPVSDNNVDLSVGSIAFFKKDPRIVYAGMGDPMFNYLGHGVLKSTDSGLTWARINNESLPSPCTVSKIEAHAENPNRVYAAQHDRVGTKEKSGFYLSLDGGKAWNRTLKGEVCDFAVHPRNSKTIYAAIETGDQPDSPSGVYMSTDSGETFRFALDLVSGSGPIKFDRSNLYLRVAVTPARPQMVYAFVSGTINNLPVSRLMTSADEGKTWTPQVVDSIDAVQPWWNLYLAVDPRDANTIYIGALDIHKSTDGGASWKNLTKNFKV